MLSIRDIVKRYQAYTALDKVSIDIPSGCIFGLLGPNGAGKTSLIRIINQITAPDSGTILMNGQPLHAMHISKIGYLPEERGLYKKMEVGEQVLYLAQLKGLSRSDATERARKWFVKFEIQAWWNKKVEDLSKGMQQKVQFICTVIHEPDLLILDEPFSGFDPLNAEIVKNEIINFYKQGRSVIFSTHRLEKIEEFVTHIALLNKSKKILDGTTKELINQYRNFTYKLDYNGDPQALQKLEDPGFEYLSNTPLETSYSATYKVKNGNVNNLLEKILPVVSVQSLSEIIPTISDIFISKVTESEHNQSILQA